MSYTYREFPELSWSISRMNTLQKCEKSYFYHYYQSHNGWEFNASEEQSESYKLKKLKNRHILCGNIVHKIIKDLILKSKQGILVTEEIIEDYIDVAIEEFRQCCSKSKKYKLTWAPSIKGFDMLQEYFYDRDITKEEGEDTKFNIFRCIYNAVNSKTFKELQTNETKKLELDSTEFKYFYIEGIKVYVNLDLLYIDKFGKYVIVDWKTGKESEDDKIQLLVYAKYISEKYNINPNNIICRLEYLKNNNLIEYTFSDADLNDVTSIIKLDMNKMERYLDDKILNKPESIDIFRDTSDSYKCKNCNFLKLCK